MYRLVRRNHANRAAFSKLLANPDRQFIRYLPNSAKKNSRLISTTSDDGKLRVAIVGGGVSGLSTALHLAPLAEKGLISKPIHLYEKTCLADVHPDDKCKLTSSCTLDENDHPGSGTIGRDIGVGIWSTALQPFLRLSHKDQPLGTHKSLIEKLENLGQYVGDVGYRTPGGSYLTRSRLNTDSVGTQRASDAETDELQREPALLFIRERDFISSLREAVFGEEMYGTIETHFAKSERDKSTEVDEIVLPTDSREDGHTGRLRFADNNLSDPYHFIISAEGIQSQLKSKYAGHEAAVERWKKNRHSLSDRYETCENMNIIEDRKYVVFRGNAPLSDYDANMNGVSFQTWGNSESMRFAAVGMSHPEGHNGHRKEEQVWFATICGRTVRMLKDSESRKEMLLEKFQDWHDPVCRLIDSTPADEILMERGVAHKHSLYPVMNLSEVMNFQHAMEEREKGAMDLPHTAGPGPALLFTGDAGMTVDPVLAQGFTIAMEAAADLSMTLESCLQYDNASFDNLAFDPVALRSALIERNQRRYGRLLCLLRSTEIVGALAQPKTDSFSGFLSKNIVRPMMMMTPSFIKEAAFSYVMKYSLGYYGSYAITKSKASICDTLKNEERTLGKEG